MKIEIKGARRGPQYELVLIIRNGDVDTQLSLTPCDWVPLVGAYGHRGVKLDQDNLYLGPPVILKAAETPPVAPEKEMSTLTAIGSAA